MKLASALAVMISIAATPVFAMQLTPEQQVQMIKMAAQLNRAAEVCKSHSPAVLASMRRTQRTEMIATGIPAERFDSVYAAQTVIATQRFNGLTPAQLKTTCDEIARLNRMKL